MPRQETKTYTVYKYSELSKEAQEQAINKFNQDHNWENRDEDFQLFLSILGYGACFEFKGLDFDKFFTACEVWGEYSDLHAYFLVQNAKLIRQIKRFKDIFHIYQEHKGHYYHSRNVNIGYEIEFIKVLEEFNRTISDIYYKDLQEAEIMEYKICNGLIDEIILSTATPEFVTFYNNLPI